MKTVLFIACACIVSVAASGDIMAEDVAARFAITKKQAQDCINKTKATQEDLKAFDDQVLYLGDELLEEADTRRAICALTCAAQARRLMVGPKLQLQKIYDFVNRDLDAPEYIKSKITSIIDTCHAIVEETNDECAVGLKFYACLLN